MILFLQLLSPDNVDNEHNVKFREASCERVTRVALSSRTTLRLSIQECEKETRRLRERRCIASWRPAYPRVITRNRFSISMSLGEVPTDRLFLPLTNVHYGHPRRLLRLLVLARSRLTCSGAVRAGKNAAAAAAS